MYLCLTEAGDASFNGPITKYVPDLAAYVAEIAAEHAVDAIGIVTWDSLRVGAPGNYLAGVVRDAAAGPAQIFQHSSTTTWFGLGPWHPIRPLQSIRQALAKS